MESPVVEQQEAARAKGIQDLREGSWLLPAEAYHLDYPNGSNREGSSPDSGDPELEEALEGVVHPTSFVTMRNQDLIERQYPDDHMRQDEELIAEYNRGYANAEDVAVEPEPAVASGELKLDEIVVVHTYTHTYSGITISLNGAGRMSVPETDMASAAIIAKLMERIAKDVADL